MGGRDVVLENAIHFYAFIQNDVGVDVVDQRLECFPIFLYLSGLN
jgi:hypothetical protein